MKALAVALVMMPLFATVAGDLVTVSNQGAVYNDPNTPIACPEGTEKRTRAVFYRELDPDWTPDTKFPPPPGYSPPRLLELPHVRNPRNLLGWPQAGYASVAVQVDMLGGVGAPEVLCSSGSAFEEAAIEAMEHARYQPASLDGTARRTIAIQPFDFRVE